MKKNILQIDAQTGRVWLTEGRQKTESRGVIEIRKHIPRNKAQVMPAGGINERAEIEMTTGARFSNSDSEPSD